MNDQKKRLQELEKQLGAATEAARVSRTALETAEQKYANLYGAWANAGFTDRSGSLSNAFHVQSAQMQLTTCAAKFARDRDTLLDTERYLLAQQRNEDQKRADCREWFVAAFVVVAALAATFQGAQSWAQTQGARESLDFARQQADAGAKCVVPAVAPDAGTTALSTADAGDS